MLRQFFQKEKNEQPTEELIPPGIELLEASAQKGSTICGGSGTIPPPPVPPAPIPDAGAYEKQ